MAQPTTREQFKWFCLRKLGAPVISINVDDDQVDDRIDEAIQYWQDYHWDGSFKTYYKYALTPTDIANQYIVLPPQIIGAIEIFDIGDALNVNNLFNIRYQIALNDLYTLTSVSMVPYYMAMTHIQFLQQMLVGRQPIRYNRYNGNKFYLDMNWDMWSPGQFVVVNCYTAMTPDQNPAAWQDFYLQRYATALIKQQWGNNLKKYGEMKLQGGIVFNGQQIYNEATEEIEKIRQDIIDSTLPGDVQIG
jgi:hypothetical protein